MSMPTFATEQYPKGLGPTVPEIELTKFNIVPHAKTCFTMARAGRADEGRPARDQVRHLVRHRD